MSDDWAWHWPWYRKVTHKCGWTLRAHEDPCDFCSERLSDLVLHGCGRSVEVWTDSVCWHCSKGIVPFQTPDV